MSIAMSLGFAPSSRSAMRSASAKAIQMGFEKEIGVQPPLGLWDPLGVLKGDFSCHIIL